MSLATHEYLCTGCPLGCRLEVDVVDGDIVEVRGFDCKRGDRYARQEHTDPRRPLSTTVAIRGASLPRLPVRTSEPIPKGRVAEVARALRDVDVRAPVQRGQVIVADVLGTGVYAIGTRARPAA
jgi:CxxC motif-containing protein